MTTPHTDWRASAAYIYILHLDSTSLAWEYLRIAPTAATGHASDVKIRGDWPGNGGCNFVEDPALDARDAAS